MDEVFLGYRGGNISRLIHLHSYVEKNKNRNAGIGNEKYSYVHIVGTFEDTGHMMFNSAILYAGRSSDQGRASFGQDKRL